MERSDWFDLDEMDSDAHMEVNFLPGQSPKQVKIFARRRDGRIQVSAVIVWRISDLYQQSTEGKP